MSYLLNLVVKRMKTACSLLTTSLNMFISFLLLGADIVSLLWAEWFLSYFRSVTNKMTERASTVGVLISYQGYPWKNSEQTSSIWSSNLIFIGGKSFTSLQFCDQDCKQWVLLQLHLLHTIVICILQQWPHYTSPCSQGENELMDRLQG